MLNEAFLHFKGIGKKKLEILQSRNIRNWQDLISEYSNTSQKTISTREILDQLQKCSRAVEESNIPFLVETFHQEDKWRLLSHYFDDLSFFDIETDGDMNRITLIVCLHRGKLYKFMRNENLNEFLDFLDEIKLMVSFNGNSFDVPLVLRHFHIPTFPVPHIDLRWVVYHLGWKGGLKRLEQDLGIERPMDLLGVDGLEAVYLWIRWIERRDVEARQKLIRYCAADVISLYFLTKKVIEKKSSFFRFPEDENLWSILENV